MFAVDDVLLISDHVLSFLKFMELKKIRVHFLMQPPVLFHCEAHLWLRDVITSSAGIELTTRSSSENVCAVFPLQVQVWEINLE